MGPSLSQPVTPSHPRPPTSSSTLSRTSLVPPSLPITTSHSLLPLRLLLRPLPLVALLPLPQLRLLPLLLLPSPRRRKRMSILAACSEMRTTIERLQHPTIEGVTG